MLVGVLNFVKKRGWREGWLLVFFFFLKPYMKIVRTRSSVSLVVELFMSHQFNYQQHTTISSVLGFRVAKHSV